MFLKINICAVRNRNDIPFAANDILKECLEAKCLLVSFSHYLTNLYQLFDCYSMIEVQ